MKKLSKSKKLLIIIPAVFLLILALITTVSIYTATRDTPDLLSWVWHKYNDYCKKKYWEEFPDNEATIYLQNTLTGITIVDQIYYDSDGSWDLYVQADTSEKAELILEKIPELTDYGKSNFKNYDNMDINCQFDHLCDHFVNCVPFEYRYEVTQNDIALSIESSDLDNRRTVCEIFENGKFPGITLIYSNIELSDKVLDNFPDLKKFELS